MTVVTRKRADKFAIIPNGVAEDARLTFEARGVLCYLLAKPHDWRVEINDIRKAGDIGRDKVYRILKELQAAGYLERIERRDTTGKIIEHEYVVYDDPVPSRLPLPENTEAAKPLPENPELALPLPEKPCPAEPDTANTDGLIRTQPLPRTQITKTHGDDGFSELWRSWPPKHHPEKMAVAQSLFTKLPSDVDRRYAARLAPAYVRMQALRGKPPLLISYLRSRAWKELIDAPEIDADGQFVITPEREEWSGWMGDIRARFGETGVQVAARDRRIIRDTRWPQHSPQHGGLPL